MEGLKIENQTILAMIQTINQEGEKSETEFIAFDEDNGSVLASESLGNKIAFINGLCMESLTICGVSQVINETHENLVQSLIFNRRKTTTIKTKMVTKMVMAKKTTKMMTKTLQQ